MAFRESLFSLFPRRREPQSTFGNEPPFQSEIFGIDRLEVYARTLAESDRVGTGRRAGRPLRERFESNRQALFAGYRAFSSAARERESLPPAAEWLLDNFYAVQGQLQQIDRDLSRGYYRELPKLAAGPYAGYPRVYGIAVELLAHTDSRLDGEIIARFVQAYQTVAPLNAGEVWAVAIMLRVALIENLRRLIGQARVSQQRRSDAGQWASRLLRLAGESRSQYVIGLADLAQAYRALDSVFVVHLLERLRDQSPVIAPVVHWLEQLLSEQGTTLDAVMHAEHQQRAANRISVGNVITSLRTLSAVDWAGFFETASVLEAELRRDPLGVYATMDFDTRDRYRHVVERLSRRTGLEEFEVARRAVAHARRFLIGHAREAPAGPPLQGSQPDLRQGHIGYYLLDTGARELEADIRYRPSVAELTGALIQRHVNFIYLGGLLGLTVLFVGLTLVYAARHGLAPTGLLGLAALAALPASALGANVVNYWVTITVPPQRVPKLDFLGGIPAEFSTMVVVPCLISSEAGIKRLFDKLEVRYLANRDPHLYFALLGDFADSPRQQQPEDSSLLEAARRQLEGLNTHYGHDGAGPFYFFHRVRCWNETEAVWMGWERKRGKLMELNRLLRGGADTSFAVQMGDLSVLKQIRYVITLDADTELPINTARRLAGAMAHPLNRPVIDPSLRRVVDGYGILQPRVAVTAPAATSSVFARLFAGESGLDPYSTAVSTVYQDLFGAGDYIGKAIYDVETAGALLHRRFPENLLLSHDLLEGSYLRTGQVTEVQLLEDFPSGYDAFIQRQHRWVRGDWQITDWLLPLVPSQGGRTQRNPLSLISRWRVFDNLRRSLVAAAVVLMLVLAWIVLPGSPLVWTVVALLPILLPDLTGLILNSGVHPPGEPWLAYFRGVARDAGQSLRQVFLLLTFLLHIALIDLDAIMRVLARRLVTHHGLLEWTSAAAAEHGQARTLRDYWARMWVAPLAAAALLGLTSLIHRAAFGPALPIAGLWVLSPFVAYWVSQPAVEQQREALLPEAHQQMRVIARRIWQFYQTFAGPEDNYLPPDNYQFEPGKTVAHRTSPTNIGFLLLSTLAAYDFGYLDSLGLAARLERILTSIEKLQRYRGHLLNWYDTRTLRPLTPEYVSTVDSGNLSACLIVVKQLCLQMGSAPLTGSAAVAGLRDTLAALAQALEAYQPAGAAPRAAAKQMSDQVTAAQSRVAGAGGTEPPAGLLAGLKDTAASIVARAQALAGIEGTPDPADVREWALALDEQVSAWQRLTSGLGELAQTESGQTLDALAAEPGPMQARAIELRAHFQTLAERAGSLSTGMDFTFLYDTEREVFAIGYHPAEQKLDNSFYDLLSSEARVASFIAIARGQAPARHWFRLGRPLAWTGGSLVSLSWSGTMFEYLMPSLLMQDFTDSLLEQTSHAVVREQEAYGAQHHVPWGVSESGFYAFDHQFNYQYQAFGIPSLGLKRELAENLVIAPYATFLALQIDPHAAWANLKALAAAGALGNYGYFEALDYTPSRRPRGEPVGVVRSYMAHHQGMSLIALDNFLHGGLMRRRFHAERAIAAVELLLQERAPRHVPLLDREAQAANENPPDAPVLEQGASIRGFVTPHTLTPRTHWLSNSAYEVMITNAGGGYSAFHEPGKPRPMSITRWRPDITQDAWGSFIYLQDQASGQLWSAAFQPSGREAELYEVNFAMDRAQFRRRDLGIETRLEIIVSPRDNAEIRRVSMTNLSRRPRLLALTSYVEVALADPAADMAHPAFSKLFVESEFVPEHSALLFRRRPREDGEPGAWLMHMLVPEQPLAGPVEYETDRARFIGRGRTLRHPQAMEQALSNTVGAVLDPVMSLRCVTPLAPGATARFVFVTGVAESRATLVDLTQRFADLRTIASTFDLAWVYSQIQLRSLNLNDEEAHQFQRLASRVIFPDRSLRAPEEMLAQNTRGQSALWAYGISGDNPIVLVRVDENEELDLVRQALRAQEYWRLNHFVVDLVILNEHATSYSDGLQGQIQAIIDSSLSIPYQDKPGGFFVRRADQMPNEDRILLATVARVVLTTEQGSLFDQLNRLRDRRLPQPRPNRPPPAAEPLAPSPAEPNGRQFDNTLGGFSPDGREYCISLSPGVSTPAPWSNVLANENFGCLLTELGLGCTWAENSQLNRLTPWSNDPVSDPPGEALYLWDEEAAQAWSATPLPIREAGGGPCRIAHGAGYSRYARTSHGIEHELTVFVPRHDPVKVMRLRLRNLDRQPRRLAVTGYAEWVLGVNRSQTQYFIVTERDARTGALLARNRYNTDFDQRVAFAHLVNTGPTAAPRPAARRGEPPASVSVTGDRTEFIGRNNGLGQPAGLERPSLSGLVGAGLDPCAAVQTRLTLRPGETAELIFLIGQGHDAPQVAGLLDDYSDAGRVQAALDAVTAFWDGLLGAVAVHTPEPAFDLLVNRWLLYQALVCRIWGRTAFYQSGGAYGYRDQLQDVLALLHVEPALARQHLLAAASRQFVEGDVQHWWHPTTGQGVRTRISDDYLWLVYATATYVTVTGDEAILDEPVPYLKGSVLAPSQQEAFVSGTASSQSGSLYEHCQRALDHGLAFGPHGLPLMGTGDWNDGMNRVGPEGKGESIWLGWFLLTNLNAFCALAEQRGDTAAASRWRAAVGPLRQALEEHGWDGAWYRRGFFDDGSPLGSALNAECQIDSIAQSWAVISGMAPEDRARQALESAWQRLVREQDALVALLAPPFDHSQPSPGYIQGYVPGTRENGGQYTHAALWFMLAHVLRGEGDRAAQLFRLINPINHALTPDDVARYKVEPYVVAADVYSHPAHLGRGGWTWYTGSAAWMYRIALEGILGVKRRGATLSIEPCLPGEWRGYQLRYSFGKASYEVQVENTAGQTRGPAVIELDGQRQPGAQINLVDDGQVHQVRVVVGSVHPPAQAL